MTANYLSEEKGDEQMDDRQELIERAIEWGRRQNMSPQAQQELIDIVESTASLRAAYILVETISDLQNSVLFNEMKVENLVDSLQDFHNESVAPEIQAMSEGGDLAIAVILLIAEMAG